MLDTNSVNSFLDGKGAELVENFLSLSGYKLEGEEAMQREQIAASVRDIFTSRRASC